MKENLKDILSNINPDIDQETLLRYLQGKLSSQEQHEIEKKLLDTDFDAEAFEGLQQVRDKQQLTDLVESLNKELRRKTARRKQRREKLKIKTDPSLWIAIAIILVLIIISYLVIHFMMRN
jgi:hypothetical protein